MVEAGRRDVYPERRLVLLRFNTWFFLAESFAIIPIHGTTLTMLTGILHLSLIWGSEYKHGVGIWLWANEFSRQFRQ